MKSKLPVKAAGDASEREADGVASKLVPMTAPARHQRSESENEKGRAAGPAHEASKHIDIEDPGTRRSGAPLSGALRSYFEPRFHHDFSQIRVHTDSEAGEKAQAMQARAYTTGRDIIFGHGEFAPNTMPGKWLLAHELAHAVQQSSGSSGKGESHGPHKNSGTAANNGLAAAEAHGKNGGLDGLPNGHSPLVKEAARFGTVQRVPAPPMEGSKPAPFDRSKIDVDPIPDLVASSGPSGLVVGPQPATAKFKAPIIHMEWQLYDSSDKNLEDSGAASTPGNVGTYVIQSNDPTRPTWNVVQGRYILRAIGFDNTNATVAYADRSFYVWTSKPTGKPPDIAALEKQKTDLEAITKKGSGKSFGEVGSAYSKLKDVTHDLSVLETGTGTYVGKQCPVVPAGATPTDCTDIVLEVLGNTFAQQGQSAAWDKVKKKYAENTKARGDTKLSGLDVQAALQSEAGWKGIFWAPDPSYQVPKAELDKANPDEASFAYAKAKKGTYYKDFGKKGYPGVSISQTVTNYAPETPKEPRKAGYPAASTTTKDTTQLDKLKKLPFGVLAAHGGEHMTIITYGKVIEVHWRKEATNVDVIEQTDLEQWAVGPQSGYHYYASGAIVAPAADVDAAFK